MHRGMAAGAPAAAELQFVRVIFVPNENLPGSEERTLRLRVTLEAKVVVALDQHLGVNRTVGTVTNGATLAQSFVLEDEGFGLIAMTLRARLIEP